MRRLCYGLAASTSLAVLVMPLLTTGCPGSACPLPKTSTLTISPQVPACLTSKLSSCARATIELDNGCDDALYVPVDYGIFADQVMPGSELEVRSKQNLIYEIKNEKATSRTSSQEDYSIPIRLGTSVYTMTFSIYADS